MLLPFHSHSPDVAYALRVSQREHYWCVPGDQPPNYQNEFVLLCSDEFGETEESTFKVIVTGALAPEMDKKTKRSIEFQRLVEQWKAERGSRSSITQAAMMRPYQEIIGMGDDAVPLIIVQLEHEGDDPDQWFWALRAITRENPVQPEDRGNFRKMAQAWIQWAEQRYAW